MSFANRFGKSFLAHSLESEDGDREVTIVDVVDSEGSENVEAAIAETEESGGDVIELVSDVEEGAKDAESLEEVADVLEETEQDGGADPVTARVAEIAVEHIYQRLGIKASGMGATSLEAFGDKATRVEATRLSVEGIREQAGNLWRAIIDLLTRLGKMISEFFKNLFVATDRTLARAKKLEGALDKMSDSTAGKKVSGSFIAKLAEKGQADKNSVINTAKNIAPYVKDVNAAIAELTAAVPKGSELAADKAKFDEFQWPVAGQITELPEQAKKWMGLKDDETTVWGRLVNKDLGAQTVAVRLPVKEVKAGADSLKALSKAQVRVVAAFKETPSADATLEALNKEEAKTVLAAVIAGMEVFIKNKDAAKEASKSMDKAIAEVKKAGSAKSDDKDFASRSSTVAATMRGFSSVISGISTQATKQAVIVAAAELEYVQKSMKASNEKSDK